MITDLNSLDLNRNELALSFSDLKLENDKSSIIFHGFGCSEGHFEGGKIFITGSFKDAAKLLFLYALKCKNNYRFNALLLHSCCLHLDKLDIEYDGLVGFPTPESFLKLKEEFDKLKTLKAFI
jgi:hypothetical protein